jgi:hypothetical protein
LVELEKFLHTDMAEGEIVTLRGEPERKVATITEGGTSAARKTYGVNHVESITNGS